MARQTLMQQLIKFEGECCVYSYLTKRAEKSAREIARHLGVTPRTIRLYRQRIREGDLGCPFKELDPRKIPPTVLGRGLDIAAWVQCSLRSLLSSSSAPLSKPEDLSESTSKSRMEQRS